MDVRVKLAISGRVQGVGFRHYCVREARRHGVRGWVRNADDGCVEVVAEGAETAVAAFVHWCRHGPPSASVLACRESYGRASGEFDAFDVAF